MVVDECSRLMYGYQIVICIDQIGEGFWVK